jgi:acetyltransferase-like isoleucine patch superfamily enzyme
MLHKIIIKLVLWLDKKQKSSVIANEYSALRTKGLLEFGEHSYGTPKIHSYEGSQAKVSIGKFCSIAPNVNIITGGIHPINNVSLFPFRIKWTLKGAFKDGIPSTNGPVIIGHDVWISTGVTILSGINIGHGAVIAAGALVTKDVPPFAVVGGNPAKIIRYRFSDEHIASLLRIAWWDWKKDKIATEIDALNSGDIDGFIKKQLQNGK